MTRWDSDNLNAAHTMRELDQEWGKPTTVYGDQALSDRIEKLERELAQWRENYGKLGLEVEAEKALADQLGTLMDKPNQSRAGMYLYRWLRVDEAVTAYRKARGL